MFAIRTTSRRLGKSNHDTTERLDTSRPVTESLEGRLMFFNPEIGDFTMIDPILGVPTLFGYPTTGGAISGILGTEVSNLWSSATPQSVGQFVQGVTSGFSPYNLRDPFSNFYREYAAPNSTPFPNYDLWLLLNGYGPQNSPNLAPLFNLRTWQVPEPVMVVQDPGFAIPNFPTFSQDPVQAGFDAWADTVQWASDYCSGCNRFGEVNFQDYSWWGEPTDAGGAGNAGSALDPGSTGSAGSETGSDVEAVAPARAAPVRTKADLKLIARIQKLAARADRDAGDLTYATTADLQSLAQSLKELPKKQAVLRKIEAAAARSGAQIADGARNLSMSLAELKSYLKQLKSGG